MSEMVNQKLKSALEEISRMDISHPTGDLVQKMQLVAVNALYELEEENDMARITVSSAAQQLGITPWAVRAQMKRGMLPIGEVYSSDKRDTFYIYQEKLNQYLGIQNKGIVND